MHRIIFGLGLVLCATSNAAPVKQQPTGRPEAPNQDGLLAHCEQLKRQADRNTCIVEVIRATAVPKEKVSESAPVLPKQSEKDVALAKAQDVFSAGDALRSVIGIGVSYNDYGPYVQRFAIALDSYRAKVQGYEELQAADLLAEALTAYNDAREFWRADIDFYAQRNNSLAYAGGLPFGLLGLAPIVAKYSLPTRNADLFGFHQGVPRGEGLAKIWEIAAGRVSGAKSALDEIGKPQNPASPVYQYATVVTANLRTRSTPVFESVKCVPVGELELGARLIEKDVVVAHCSDGRQESVACTSSSCEAIKVDEFRMEL
jgi:hypothetical protein